ncbi:MAG: FeoA family protein [Cyclobacteriaceae bacterium]
MKARSVVDLLPGEMGVINGLTDEKLSLKLLEMGVLPGSEIKYNFAAPLGDPICVSVSGYNLSLRLDEAITISIQ